MVKPELVESLYCIYIRIEKKNKYKKCSKPNSRLGFYGDEFLIGSVTDTVTITSNENLAMEKKGFSTSVRYMFIHALPNGIHPSNIWHSIAYRPNRKWIGGIKSHFTDVKTDAKMAQTSSVYHLMLSFSCDKCLVFINIFIYLFKQHALKLWNIWFLLNWR